MAEGKKSFVAYSDWKELFDVLPDEDAGKLIKHIFAYVNDENPETDSVLIKAVFANIKSTLKRDLKKWEKQMEQRREAGRRSAEVRSTKFNDRSTTVNERQRNSTDSVSVSVNDSVSVNVNENVSTNVDVKDSLGVFSPKQPTKVFKPPTIDEVRVYCKERNNNINPEDFIDHYKSNGWMVGKTKMKDWQATVRKWERNKFNSKNKDNDKPKQSNIEAIADWVYGSRSPENTNDTERIE